MKKTLFILFAIALSFGLNAQTKGNRKIELDKNQSSLPINKDAVKGDFIQNEPYMLDQMLSKCDRYKRHYKRLLKLILTSNPEPENPLNITSQIRQARILYVAGSTGHIVIDKTPGSVSFPLIATYQNQPLNGVFPVPVTHFGFLQELNGQVSTVGLSWETGVYDDVVRVEDIYRLGNQTYADLKRADGSLSTIMIFVNHQMDGCQIDER